MFVYPTRHDGPPRPIRDALAMNKRVVITREANIHDDVERMGWGCFCDPNPSSLAQALFRFENSQHERIIMDPVYVLSWDSLAKKFLEAYGNVLSPDMR